MPKDDKSILTCWTCKQVTHLCEGHCAAWCVRGQGGHITKANIFYCKTCFDKWPKTAGWDGYSNAQLRENVHCQCSRNIPDSDDDDDAGMQSLQNGEQGPERWHGVRLARPTPQAMSHASRLEALENENIALWQRVQRAENEVQGMIVFLMQWGYNTQ